MKILETQFARKCRTGAFQLFLAMFVFFGCGGSTPEGQIRRSFKVTSQHQRKLALDGVWEFRFAKSLDELKVANDTLLKVPGNWVRGTRFSNVGYGEYRVTIENPEQVELGLLLPFIVQEYRVYVNKVLLKQSRDFSPDESRESLPGRSRPLIKLPPARLIELQIIVRNQKASLPGIKLPPILDDWARITYQEDKRRIFELAGLGILFIIFIYHSILYAFLKVRSHLWLAMIAFIICIRGTVVYDSFFALFYLVPELDFALAKKIEYGLLYLTPCLLLLMFSAQFQIRKYDKLIKVMAIVNVLSSIFVALSPVATFEYSLHAFHLLILMTLVLCLDIIRIAVINALATSKIVLFGLVITSLLTTLEILKNSGVIYIDFGSNILSNAVVIYIFIQAVALSAQMARVYRENKFLNDNLEKSVELKTIELSSANALKGKILSVVTHDLRNPLANLKGSLDLLNENILTFDDFQKMKAGITEKIDGNIKMMEEVLHWSSLELRKDKDSEEQKTCQFQQVCTTVLRQVQPLAFEKRIKLESSFARSVRVAVDQDALVIILRNLITNAIKFTNPHGSVQVTAQQIDGFVEISVIDNGVGMSEESKQQITLTNVSVSSSGTMKEKGAGVGLLIVKDLIQQNNGVLKIKNNEGKNGGTIFYFRLKECPGIVERQVEEEEESGELP